jgi:hypothetical protein
MREIEDKISVLVKNHFPDFYKEEGNTFIEFVKEYYSWAEQSNNTLFFTRNLLEYRDIDKTIDSFLVHFKSKYYAGSPIIYGQARDNVKHSLDFYRSKGTEQGTKLVLQQVWGIESEVYYPGNDVLRASDGSWRVPVYLEVSISEKTKDFIGQTITGSISGATAFADSVSRRNMDGKILDVVYLTDVIGNFVYGELITADGSFTDCPRVVGSLTSLVINSGGGGFVAGDILAVESSRKGKQGLARVDSVVDSTGRVEFTLINGGSGYGSNTVVTISTKELALSNITSSNSFVSNFEIDETVYQPLANVAFENSNVYFNYGTLIVGANSTANVATGRVVGKDQQQITGVVSSNSTSNVVVGTNTKFVTEISNGDFIMFQSCTTPYEVSSVSNNTILNLTTTGPNTSSNSLIVSTGSILVIVNTGDFGDADRIATTSANITSYTDRTASGKVVDADTRAIGFTNVVNVFTGNGYNYIYGGTSNVYANVTIVGTGVGASFSIGSRSSLDISYLGTDIIGDYANTLLNASTFGFPKLASANVSTIINNAIDEDAYVTGSILSLSGINTGNNYNISPFVTIRDPLIINSEIGRQYLFLSNVSSTPVVGEIVTQSQPKPSYVLAVSGSASAMTTRETFTQTINATSNAYGLVQSANTSSITVITTETLVNSSIGSALSGTVTSNSTSAQVNGTSTAFTTDLSAGDFIKFSGNNKIFQVNSISNDTVLFLTSNAAVITSSNTISIVSNVALGMTSGVFAFVNTATSNTYSYTSKGYVSEVIPSSISESSLAVIVDPITLSLPFAVGYQLSGLDSGSTGNVVSRSADTSIIAGNNAVVNSYAGTINGAMSTVTVIDSGFAYEKDEIVTLRKSNTTSFANCTVVLDRQGVGQGYFENTDGFLNSDKYIHDGDFYQAFSYQVQTSVDLDKYGEVLKKISHVAGTKLFGKLFKSSAVSASINSVGLQIET